MADDAQRRQRRLTISDWEKLQLPHDAESASIHLETLVRTRQREMFDFELREAARLLQRRHALVLLRKSIVVPFPSAYWALVNLIEARGPRLSGTEQAELLIDAFAPPQTVPRKAAALELLNAVRADAETLAALKERSANVHAMVYAAHTRHRRRVAEIRALRLSASSDSDTYRALRSSIDADFPP